MGCPEEVALGQGWINDEQLERLAQPLLKSGYGAYLLQMLQEAAVTMRFYQHNLERRPAEMTMPAETLFTESGSLNGPLLICPPCSTMSGGSSRKAGAERRFRHDLISAEATPPSRYAPVQAGQPLPIQPRCAARFALQLPPEPKGKLMSCSVGGNGERNNYQVVEAICNLMDQLRPQGAPHTRLITMLQPPTRFPALKREQSCTVQTQTDQT